MTTLTDWADECVALACARSGYFWSGARKIFPHRHWRIPRIDDTLTLSSIGFTPYKLTRLRALYTVPDQIDIAMRLHERNVNRRKYASASFSCFGHLLKSSLDDSRRSKRASVMGACLLSVTISLRPHENRTVVDISYRTTEWAKKFPADLIFLRDDILPLIPGQDRFPINEINFFFSNVTCHPMYFPTILPHRPDPVATLRLIAQRDPAFHEWAGKWLVRYLVGGAASRSIDKFAQAQRTAEATRALITGDTRKALVLYLCDNRRLFSPSRTRFDADELSRAFDTARSLVDGA